MSVHQAPRRPYAARMPMDQRREQLLDAALALIVRDGYESVTVESVAREAGVTRPVVYGAFDGLPDLLGRLLDRQQQVASSRLLAALPQTLDGEDMIATTTAVARRLAIMVRDDPTTWGPILAGSPGTPRAVHERIAASRHEVVEAMAGLFTRRTGPGPLRGADPHVLAHALVAAMEDGGRQLLADPDDRLVDRIVDTVAAVAAALTTAPAVYAPSMPDSTPADSAAPTTTVLHNTACSTSRHALAVAADAPIDVEVVQYLKQPLDRAALLELIDKLEDPAADLVRKDKFFREQGLDAGDYTTPEQVADLLVEHPRLMERPVLVRGDRAIIGRPKDRVLPFLADTTT